MSEPAIRGELDFAAQRRIMVDRQIRTFNVTDGELLAAALACPRERYVPNQLASLAYSDASLEVGHGGAGETRRLLAPMVLVRLIESLQVNSQDQCLDVGGGGGYGAAILARLARSVTAVENSQEFSHSAQTAFLQDGLTNATTATGSLWDGGGMAGPFDVILLNGATEVAPAALLSLLSEGGRLAAILKDPADATGAAAFATLWTKSRGGIGQTQLFNASAQVLPGFAAPRSFAF